MAKPATVTQLPTANNPWAAVVGPQYSLEKFYCAASDTQGHGKTIHVRMPPNLVNEIAYLIREKLLDKQYRGVADFLRDAAVHRAQYLANTTGIQRLQNQLDLYLVEETIEADINEALRKQGLIERKKRACEIHLESQDWKSLNLAVTEGYQACDLLDEHHAGKMEEMLRPYTKELTRVRKAGIALSYEES